MFTCIPSAFVMPFSQTINGRMGYGIGTIQLMKMVGGTMAPGRPIANLYVHLDDHSLLFSDERRYLSLQCGVMTLLTSLSDL